MRIFTDLKKRAALAALCVVMLCMIAGCEKAGAGEGEPKESSQAQVSAEATPEASQVATPEPTPEATPDPTPEPTPSPEEIYAQMVELSLMYEGNYERLQKFIEKLRAGEEVKVAMLGGSVTEGAGAGSNDKGYAYQFVKALKETYGNGSEEQIHYVVAGLSGTPSVLGLMRYQQDVLDVL
ncbi:MAG: SGNH/GDSL hydrolase family protein, partial [Lachnospiraceae bacterium]|nr:SGNH/GDSL hydrolase family protein [Lachnospiraceae bacterium]